jgi:hypothetical protein
MVPANCSTLIKLEVPLQISDRYISESPASDGGGTAQPTDPGVNLDGSKNEANIASASAGWGAGAVLAIALCAW